VAKFSGILTEIASDSQIFSTCLTEISGILTEIASDSQIRAQEEWWQSTQGRKMMQEDTRR
jgi:hypothetical protein